MTPWPTVLDEPFVESCEADLPTAKQFVVWCQEQGFDLARRSAWGDLWKAWLAGGLAERARAVTEKARKLIAPKDL